MEMTLEYQQKVLDKGKNSIVQPWTSVGHTCGGCGGEDDLTERTFVFRDI